MTQLSLIIEPETKSDTPAVEKLCARTFGPGRYARTAYRLRENNPPLASLSFVARVGTFLVGANRMTQIFCNNTPVLLLGPLTVDPAFRARGIGEALVEHSLAASKAAGHKLVLLVGDLAYYEREGFARVPPGKITLPGPVDPARLLYVELEAGTLAGVSGMLQG